MACPFGELLPVAFVTRPRKPSALWTALESRYSAIVCIEGSSVRCRSEHVKQQAFRSNSVLGTSGECEAEQINGKIALWRRRRNRSDGQNRFLVFMVKAGTADMYKNLAAESAIKKLQKASFVFGNSGSIARRIMIRYETWRTCGKKGLNSDSTPCKRWKFVSA